MKLVIIVPDGLCDIRYPALDNLSPVEYANTPALDNLVGRGQVGLVRTMYDGLPLGSLVGLLGLLGYDPRAYFPLGRSIFEARALGLKLAPGDVALRCNIVRASKDGRLVDFTAGHINDDSARKYLAECLLPANVELHHDLSYRNVLIFRDCPWSVSDLELVEPHDNVGSNIDQCLPCYRGQRFEPLAELMLASRRNGLMLWPWAASRMRTFPRLRLNTYVVTALSFLYGLTEMLGGHALIPAGATGFLGSDLSSKVKALSQALAEVDLAIVHCNAPDEEAHVNNLYGKVQAIEDIDRQVVRPLLAHLENAAEPCRILICPDHYTCCYDGKHHSNPVPYVVTGHGITASHSFSTYSEAEISNTKAQVLESYRLVTTLRQ
jgi:2,3-bisphosphoglycerate-independent phosphoglycerate mutase